MMMKGLMKAVLKGVLDALNVALLGLPKLNSKVLANPAREIEPHWEVGRVILNTLTFALPALVSWLNKALKRG